MMADILQFKRVTNVYRVKNHMNKERTAESREEDRLMGLSTRISYGAIIKNDREVEITREMMSKACQKMESMQSFPFRSPGKE